MERFLKQPPTKLVGLSLTSQSKHIGSSSFEAIGSELAHGSHTSREATVLLAVWWLQRSLAAMNFSFQLDSDSIGLGCVTQISIFNMIWFVGYLLLWQEDITPFWTLQGETLPSLDLYRPDEQSPDGVIPKGQCLFFGRMGSWDRPK